MACLRGTARLSKVCFDSGRGLRISRNDSFKVLLSGGGNVIIPYEQFDDT